MSKDKKSGGSYQGTKTGPNAPSHGSGRSGGTGNGEQTIATAKSAYKKARGG